MYTHISKWDYFRPTVNSINASEEVVVSLIRGKWTSDVNVDMVNSSVRNKKLMLYAAVFLEDYLPEYLKCL